jgi:vancomycin aglycone glucosyltransferase
VVLSTYDSRGGIEPMLALAVQLQALGAEATLCAPPDCAERAAEVGVPLVPVGYSVRDLVHAPTPPTPADVPKRAAELMAAQFDALAPAAEGADALVTSGLVPVVAAARSVGEMLGIRSEAVSYCPIYLPSPHHRPQPLPLRPIPPEVTDTQELDRIDRENYNSLFGELVNAHRAQAGLPPVDDVRGLVLGDRPWLAADPVLAPWQEPAPLDVVQTGAWILPDDRPLPADLEEFLDAGAPPVYVSYGSLRAPQDLARVAIEAIRAQGRRVVLGRGWAGLAAIDDGDDCFEVGEVNQQALFGRVAAVVHHGGAGTTTTATRAGVPQVVVPQMADQPYFASRVAALGIGAAHDGPAPTTESLSSALGKALTDETRARARAVAGTVRTDGARRAAEMLLGTVA